MAGPLFLWLFSCLFLTGVLVLILRSVGAFRAGAFCHARIQGPGVLRVSWPLCLPARLWICSRRARHERRHGRRMKATLSAVRDDPGRTAMCITLILHGADRAESRFPTVLHELHLLEEQAQVVRHTDKLGVVRWHVASETDTHGPQLGAEIQSKTGFTLTPVQLDALGL